MEETLSCPGPDLYRSLPIACRLVGGGPAPLLVSSLSLGGEADGGELPFLGQCPLRELAAPLLACSVAAGSFCKRTSAAAPSCSAPFFAPFLPPSSPCFPGIAAAVPPIPAPRSLIGVIDPVRRQVGNTHPPLPLDLSGGWGSLLLAPHGVFEQNTFRRRSASYGRVSPRLSLATPQEPAALIVFLPCRSGRPFPPLLREGKHGSGLPLSPVGQSRARLT